MLTWTACGDHVDALCSGPFSELFQLPERDATGRLRPLLSDVGEDLLVHGPCILQLARKLLAEIVTDLLTPSLGLLPQFPGNVLKGQQAAPWCSGLGASPEFEPDDKCDPHQRHTTRSDSHRPGDLSWPVGSSPERDHTACHVVAKLNYFDAGFSCIERLMSLFVKV